MCLSFSSHFSSPIFINFLIELECWNVWCGSGGLTHPKSQMSSPIFKRFLIELYCWNFRWGLKSPFCMRLFRIFIINHPSPLSLPNVKFFIYCVMYMKFETQHFKMFTNNNWDIIVSVSGIFWIFIIHGKNNNLVNISMESRINSQHFLNRFSFSKKTALSG